MNIPVEKGYALKIDNKEHIYLDGEELKNISRYCLEHKCGEMAKLTVEINIREVQVSA